MDYKKLEEENKILRDKLEHIKITKAKYFQEHHKHKVYHCDICNKDIKYNSLWYHNQSKKHMDNKNKINLDLDNYFENNIN